MKTLRSDAGAELYKDDWRMKPYLKVRAVPIQLFRAEDGKPPFLDINDLLSHFSTVLGTRGTGKSSTAILIAENCLANKVPCIFLDISGEYAGLGEFFNLRYYDFMSSKEGEREIVQRIYSGESAIFDLSKHLSRNEVFEHLVCFFAELWEQGKKTPIPVMIFVEEAHNFIPRVAPVSARGKGNVIALLKEIFTRLALEGRKYGFGAVIISQRSAMLDTNIIAQADNFLLHKVSHPRDVKVYYDLIPLHNRIIDVILQALQVGECVFITGKTPPQMRKVLRHISPYLGKTPDFRQIAEMQGWIVGEE